MTKPYYETELGKLYHGDCLTIMPQLEPVDLVLTDPPYGTTACKWDSIVPLDLMWKAITTIRKLKTPVVLFGTEPFSSMLRMSNLQEFKYDWIWDRGRACNAYTAKQRPLKYHEIVSVFFNSNYYPIMSIGRMIKKASGGKSELFNTDNPIERNENCRYYPTSLIVFKACHNMQGKIHPTQKPVSLISYLIETYTNKNDLTLDFTIGSGTTAIACERLNRKWIGIEIEEKYCEISAKRIEAERKQLKLF